MSDPAPAPEPQQDLDPAAEAERLDRLQLDIDDVRRRAADDLEVGAPGRTFTDAGVAAQVEGDGDTEHPPVDR